jgi:hypothetical protein
MSQVSDREVVDPTVLSVVVTAFRRARLRVPDAWEPPFLIDFGDGSPQVSTDSHLLDHEFPALAQYAVPCEGGLTGYEFTVSADDIGQNEASRTVRFCPAPTSLTVAPSGPEVSAPPYVGRSGTLLDVASVTDSAEPSWTSGFITRDPCPGSVDTDLGSCLAAPVPKSPGVGSMFDGWAPFTVYAYYSCSPAGITEEEARAAAEGTLTAKQSMAVELEMLLGLLRGASYGAQAQATDLGNFAVVDALAVLCGGYHQLNGDGQGLILVGISTGTLLATNGSIERVSGRFVAPCGCPVVLSAALDNLASFPAPELYHLGATKVMAGPAFDLGVHVSSVNDRTLIVERTFGVAWTCDPVMTSAPAITPAV